MPQEQPNLESTQQPKKTNSLINLLINNIFKVLFATVATIVGLFILTQSDIGGSLCNNSDSPPLGYKCASPIVQDTFIENTDPNRPIFGEKFKVTVVGKGLRRLSEKPDILIRFPEYDDCNETYNNTEDDIKLCDVLIKKEDIEYSVVEDSERLTFKTVLFHERLDALFLTNENKMDVTIILMYSSNQTFDFSPDSAEIRDLGYGTCAGDKTALNCSKTIERYCKTHEQLDGGGIRNINPDINTIEIACWNSENPPTDLDKDFKPRTYVYPQIQ